MIVPFAIGFITSAYTLFGLEKRNAELEMIEPYEQKETTSHKTLSLSFLSGFISSSIYAIYFGLLYT